MLRQPSFSYRCLSRFVPFPLFALLTLPKFSKLVHIGVVLRNFQGLRIADQVIQPDHRNSQIAIVDEHPPLVAFFKHYSRYAGEQLNLQRIFAQLDDAVRLKECGFTYRPAEKAWTSPRPATTTAEIEPPPPVSIANKMGSSSCLAAARPHETELVQRLPWDFRKTFPHPTEEAIEAGAIGENDCNPDSICSLHEEHARHLLSALRALDTVLDARRRGVDPGTGKKPRSHGARERLRKYLDEEPGRLERSFTATLGVYEDVFGSQAADTFTKALRACHAGIDVVADNPCAGEGRIRIGPLRFEQHRIRSPEFRPHLDRCVLRSDRKPRHYKNEI
jgi:hypothetical protein